jgi:hypothetical protein
MSELAMTTNRTRLNPTVFLQFSGDLLHLHSSQPGDRVQQPVTGCPAVGVRGRCSVVASKSVLAPWRGAGQPPLSGAASRSSDSPVPSGRAVGRGSRASVRLCGPSV